MSREKRRHSEKERPDKRAAELDIDDLNIELEKSMLGAESSEPELPGYETYNKYSRKNKTGKNRAGNIGSRAKKVIAVILILMFVLLGGLAGVLFGMGQLGKRNIKQDKTDEEITGIDEASLEDEGKIVVYKGEKYRYNENIISILCMGVDKSLEDTGDETIGENGQADSLILAAMDTESGQLILINVSRDSMVDVNQYNYEGNFLGTEKMQICLAYSYGDGGSKSCENTMTSVSRYLYGMPINGYVAIDYNAIGVLNDAIDGVSVTILEDMTAVDPELKQGESVVLKGEQAHRYVRYRDTAELASNNSRMERQRQYLGAFIAQAIQQTKDNMTVPLSLYRAAGDDMVTDIDASQVTYLASLLVQHGFSAEDMRSVEGEVVAGEIYAEFYPDETQLYELILDVFYNKV